MSHMLPHLSQNTSTRSLSLVFRPPSLSCPSELDQETLRDSRPSGRYTKSASPNGYEPKLIQSDDFEPRRIELDRNLGTDLQPERIELDQNIGIDPYQIPWLSKTDHRRYGENWKIWWRHALPPIKDTLRLRFSWKHCRLGSWRWRITKNAGLTAVCTWARKILCFFSRTHSFRGTRSKNNAEERSKCTTYSSCSLQKRELEVKFISRATSVWETGCIVFIKERRTGEAVRKFYVQICWSVKIGKISSWK